MFYLVDLRSGSISPSLVHGNRKSRAQGPPTPTMKIGDKHGCNQETVQCPFNLNQLQHGHVKSWSKKVQVAQQTIDILSTQRSSYWGNPMTGEASNHSWVIIPC